MESLFLARARDLIYQQTCLFPLTVSLRPIAVVTTFHPIYQTLIYLPKSVQTETTLRRLIPEQSFLLSLS